MLLLVVLAAVLVAPVAVAAEGAPPAPTARPSPAPAVGAAADATVPRPIEPGPNDDSDDDDERDVAAEEVEADGGDEGDDGKEADEDEEHEESDRDDDPRSAKKKPFRLPVPDPRDAELSATFWGSSTGCVLGGCAPAVGTVAGAGALLAAASAPLAAPCATASVVVGAPAALVLGPCASGTALAGGLVGAAFEDRDAIPLVLGALPGVAVGALGTAGAIWGLLELGRAPAGDVWPHTVLGIAAAASWAAGPLTITGMTLADRFAPPLPAGVRDVREDRPSETDRPDGSVSVAAPTMSW